MRRLRRRHPGLRSISRERTQVVLVNPELPRLQRAIVNFAVIY